MMKNLKKELQSVNKDLKALTKKIDKMIVTVGKVEKPKPKAAKPKPKKKVAAKKPAAKKVAKETAANVVLNIIKGSEKGVGTPALVKKTGFNQKKIANIVFKLKKQGVIKSVGRGVYVKA